MDDGDAGDAGKDGLSQRSMKRRAAAAGAIAWSAPVILDNTLVVPEPSLGYDATALAELEARFPPRGDEAAFGAARMPIEGIVILGLEALDRIDNGARRDGDGPIS